MVTANWENIVAKTISFFDVVESKKEVQIIGTFHLISVNCPDDRRHDNESYVLPSSSKRTTIK